MSHSYRCSKAGCRKRVSFKHLKDWYVISKLCPACGNDSLKLDMTRKTYNQANRCNCDGYHFPHRLGSLWCNLNMSQRTDEDYQNRHVN